MKEKKETNGWLILLKWEKDLGFFTKVMYNNLKNIIVWKFLNKCPSCFSNNLQFVEGTKRFVKWFCRDCTAMHFAYGCQHCKKMYPLLERLEKENNV